MRVCSLVACMLTGRRGKDMPEYDSEGNELDKHGFKVQVYPEGLESVRKSVENCEMMCGLDKNVMMELLKGEWSEYTTLNSVGRSSKKIVIEYNIKQKDD